MHRAISLAILVVLVLLLAILFYQVMIGFLLPLFLATLLAILFQPLHREMVRLFHGHDRIAAGVTTALILVIVLAPLAFTVFKAATEATAILARPNQKQQSDNSATETTRTDEPARPADAQQSETTEGLPNSKAQSTTETADKRATGLLNMQTLNNIVKNLNDRFSLNLNANKIRSIAESKAQEFLGPLAAKTPGVLGGLLINCLVTVLGLYYFLADGTNLTASGMRMLPLDQKYQRELVGKFVEMSRAVTSASLVAAIVQGILLGFGYYFAGLGGVFLLTIMTMLASFIPLVGSSIVWGACCIWLLFSGSVGWAIALAIWSLAVAMGCDNVLKSMILHGQSQLHPLLGLLSVLGGVQVLGPLGIFFGPMAVAFLQAGLTMLNTELRELEPGTVKPTVAEMTGHESKPAHGRHHSKK